MHALQIIFHADWITSYIIHVLLCQPPRDESLYEDVFKDGILVNDSKSCSHHAFIIITYWYRKYVLSTDVNGMDILYIKSTIGHGLEIRVSIAVTCVR